MKLGFQQITVILLFLWFVMFVAGKLQQGRIKKELFKRIREGLAPAREKDPDLSLSAYYAWVFEGWDQLVKKNAWFILGPSELYPVSADPERVRSRMNLTPAWLGAYLKLSGVELAMTEDEQAAVDAIVASVPPERLEDFPSL
jgi:hypothetical protein